MKRLVTLIGACVLAAGLMTGCHGKNAREGFVVPDTFNESGKYEITFWAKNDTNKAQTKIYQKAIEDFQALYPNISVKMRLYTDYGKIYNDVITNIATGTTPNVCITYPDHIATYLTGSDVVVPLDGLFENEKYGLGGTELAFDGPSSDEMIPEFLSECVIRDQHWAVPYMRSTEACYINKTYVEALGYEVPDILTWDYIWEVSEAALAKDKKGNFKLNGQKVMIPFIDKSTDNMMIQMLRQLDAPYSTDEGGVEIFTDTTKEILTTIGAHAGSGAFSTFKISSYPANFLNAGQCLFAIDSTAGATWMGSDAPLLDIAEDKVVRFETVVRPFPQYDAEHPEMISQGPSICLFNKQDPQEVLASWLFAQYLLSNDVQIAYAETEGYVPVTSKAQQSEEYQDYLSRSGEDSEVHYPVKIDAARLLLDNTENTFVTPVFNGSASLRDAAGQMIENVCKLARRNAPLDDKALDEVFSKVSSLYRLDQIQTSGDETGGRRELGPLPATSTALIAVLCAVWALILLYLLSGLIRKMKSQKS